jgi:hypothetical protein
MAHITGGIGKFVSGKLGEVVFVQREGMTYIRKLPEYSKDSWSPSQKQHRERFRLVNAFCRQYRLQIIQPIWNKAPGKGSGYSRFLKANMPAFGLDGQLADKSMLHFSDGVLPFPFHFSVTIIEGENDKIQVSWENDSLISGMYTMDELFLVPALTDGFGKPFNTGIRRSASEATIVLPVESSKIEAVYLFFSSVDRKRYSPDKYFAFHFQE